MLSPTRDEIRERASAMIGGAWHPDSPRIGVPGILSGSALLERTDTETEFKEVT